MYSKGLKRVLDFLLALAAVVILRAGLGMLDGVLSLVPSAKVGHIGIYKDEKTGELVRYYCKMPQDIVHRQVLLLEPILATGETTDMAVQMLENVLENDLRNSIRILYEVVMDICG